MLFRYLCTFLFMFNALFVSSQIVIGEKAQQNVVLFSGDTLSADSIVYQSVSVDRPVFHLGNDTTVASDSVRFVTNFHGTLANLDSAKRNADEDYALRIRNGEVSVFEEVEIEIYGGRHLAIQRNGSRLGQHPDLASGENYDYYSMDSGELKKVKYKNLKVDLWESEESKEELKAFKRYRYLQIGLVTAGLGVATVTYLNNSNETMSPLTLTGLLVAGCSIAIEFPKRDALNNAIDFYNN